MIDVRSRRVAAAIIDLFFILFFAIVGSIIMSFIIDSYFLVSLSFLLYIVSPSIFSLTMLAYYTLIPYLLKGATIGKAIVKIKVVTLSYQTPSFSQYFKRNIYFFLSLLICIFSFSIYIRLKYPYGTYFVLLLFLVFLVYFILNSINLLMIIATDEQRGIHDFIAKTYVVYKHFSTDPLNQINLLEKEHMDWAIFEGEEQKTETISETNNEDEIEILKRID